MTAAVVGIGLIGGSFALALKRHGLAERVVGVESSALHAQKALDLGLVDEIVSLDKAAVECDLIAVATPVNTIPTIVTKLLNRVGEGQVVIDMGSTKEELCELVSGHRNRARFVATHPMWGTEHSGPEAAEREAFTGRVVVFCERDKSAEDAVHTVEKIYQTLGMKIIDMGAEEHDMHTAYVSHISHITSFALALTVLEKEREEEHIFDLAGGGFESTVRLAKSSADTWIPILLENKYNVLDVLREHIHQLQIMRRMIERDDQKGLREAMDKANSIKRILK